MPGLHVHVELRRAEPRVDSLTLTNALSGSYLLCAVKSSCLALSRAWCLLLSCTARVCVQCIYTDSGRSAVEPVCRLRGTARSTRGRAVALLIRRGQYQVLYQDKFISCQMCRLCARIALICKGTHARNAFVSKCQHGGKGSAQNRPCPVARSAWRKTL